MTEPATQVLRFIAAAFVTASLFGANAPPVTASALDQGFRQMYNLQFVEAHDTFHKWTTVHPEDPMGAVSDAAAYLFAEFDRLHILQSEFFTEDADFKSRVKPTGDPRIKAEFQKQIAECERLAMAALARNPQDRNAQFARILALGLQSDYLALIEKRYVASLRLMKNGRTMAQDLLAKDPSYYDAYLAVGVENYMLGTKAAPVRWMLSLAGAQTDKAKGIEELKLTAAKGRYLEPFARLLLAVAALRDNDKSKARDLLAGLARQFPNNQLYTRELARLR
jgi:hypothetical protein